MAKITQYTAVINTEGPWFPNHEDLEKLIVDAVSDHTEGDAFPTAEIYEGDLAANPLSAKKEGDENIEEDCTLKSSVATKKSEDDKISIYYSIDFYVYGSNVAELHDKAVDALLGYLGEIEDEDGKGRNWSSPNIMVSVASPGLLRGHVSSSIRLVSDLVAEEGDDGEPEDAALL